MIPQGAKRNIKCTDLRDGVSNILPSKYQAAKYAALKDIKASPALVHLICEGKNHVKTAGKKMIFEYADDEEVTHKFEHGRTGKTYKKRTEEESICEHVEE